MNADLPLVCARLAEVEAAHDGRLGVADLERLERHTAVCSECRAERQRLQALQSFARERSQIDVAPLAARRARAALLRVAASPQPERSRRLVLPFVFIAVALVAMAGLAWRRPHAETRAHVAALSTVEAIGAADWSRAVSPERETVALRAGMIRVRVPHQHAGHRFLIALPDGVVEVRGTQFLIEVRAGVTERLDVFEGTVALRVGGHVERMLEAGDRWAREVLPERVALSEQPTSTGLAVPTEARAIRRSTVRRSDYAAGVDALDRGDLHTAARLFEAFETAHPADDRAEDAGFLLVIALRRAEGDTAAESSARRYLARYPLAARRWDASLVVARAARARGDCESLRAALAEFAGGGPRASAVEGLIAGCTPRRE